MSTFWLANMLCSCLAEMTGTRSSGNIVVTATGADRTVKANTFLVPIKPGESGLEAADFSRLIRVDADTVVTSGGVSVPVTSHMGGAGQDWPDGTVFRFFPALQGVEVEATASGAIAGSAALGEPCELKRVVFYETIGNDVGQDLTRAAGARATPSAILTWDGTDQNRAAGSKVSANDDRWTFFVVVDRMNSHSQRAHEGLSILDIVTQLIAARTGVDGTDFSGPQIVLTGRRRVRATAASYIYAQSFRTHGVFRHRGKLTEATYYDWLRTKFTVNAVPSDAGLDPETLAIVMNATYPHTLEE